MAFIDFVVYVIAQLIGGVLGFGLLKLVTPTQYAEDLCTTLLQHNLHISQGLVIEIVITSALCFVLGAVLDERNAHKSDSIPLRFGLTVSCLSMVAGPYTGASMNSARSFAPALLNNNWKDHWIYWLGPTLGAVFASVFYRYILEPPLR
ncbi:hypothetical protein ILUMI_02403 [Ignelater luminosus]|uniref:Uncharacterized protein n=1 Tax=Ignelater luminosus TaxID=2038154 RepID=A0A8K0DGH9_IGNLU|nr:hypothetical protein ILUMI_02403 [Ignelater luminosus]